MKQPIVSALIVTAAALLASGYAQAADGAVCYSGLLSHTVTGTPGTLSYPQLSNTSKFNCGWTTTYTVKELSQQGWIIGSVQPTIYSQTMNSDGSMTMRSRYMLVIQK